MDQTIDVPRVADDRRRRAGVTRADPLRGGRPETGGMGNPCGPPRPAGQEPGHGDGGLFPVHEPQPGACQTRTCSTCSSTGKMPSSTAPPRSPPMAMLRIRNWGASKGQAAPPGPLFT